MRNLFALVGFVVVVFLGLGWYLGWYKLDWASGSDGKTTVKFDVDTKKVGGDLQAGANRAGEFIDNLKTKSSDAAKKQAADPAFVGPLHPADLVDTKSPSAPAGLTVPKR